jgi:hypothetical protein
MFKQCNFSRFVYSCIPCLLKLQNNIKQVSTTQLHYICLHVYTVSTHRLVPFFPTFCLRNHYLGRLQTIQGSVFHLTLWLWRNQKDSLRCCACFCTMSYWHHHVFRPSLFLDLNESVLLPSFSSYWREKGSRGLERFVVAPFSSALSRS